jgi:hypothetical protein
MLAREESPGVFSCEMRHILRKRCHWLLPSLIRGPVRDFSVLFAGDRVDLLYAVTSTGISLTGSGMRPGLSTEFMMTQQPR